MTPLGARRIPLNDDVLFHLSLSLPSVFTGFVGQLDAAGGAQPVFAVHPVFRDTTFHAAVLTLRAGAPFGIGEISAPLPVVVAR